MISICYTEPKPNCKILSNEEKRIVSLSSWFVFIALESLVLIQAILAFRNHFLTVNQMQDVHMNGLPFLWHFGMWGDFFIVSPVVAYLVRHHLYQWRWRSVMFSFTVGSISAILLGWLYTLSAIPEAHMLNHHLTAAGVIHLLYMTISVTIFLEYLLFTSHVSASELKVVSSLVIFHVLLGTHMALGILQLFMVLDWYPGEPLKSSIGYLTILTITTALLLRNLDLRSFASNTREVAQRLVQIFMNWVENDPFWQKKKIKTPHGLLKFLDAIGGHILEAGFFLEAARRIYTQNEGIKSLLPSILVFVFAAKFFLSRRSVKVELTIGEKLFPSGLMPKDWSGPREPFGIIISVICFFILYMALVWFAYKIILVSLAMFIIGCIDWNTRRLIHKNIGRFFSDEKYAPRTGDKDFEAIQARREVVREYLFNNPHLWKEGGCAIGCGVALCVAVAAHFVASDRLKSTAYVLMIVTLLVNEIVTWRWRAIRDRRWREIDEKFNV